MSSGNDPSYWEELLRSIYGGRRWLITAGVLAAATDDVGWLRGMGCPDPFIVSGSVGTGPLPDVPEENIGSLGVGGAGVMSAIRAFYAAAHGELPEEIQGRLDRWDPDGTALVLAEFLDVDLPVGGRPQFGARPEAWTELESKIVIDDLWDEAGIARAPSLIVPIEWAAVAAAVTDLDAGDGVVLAGDNREGWHGGGELVRFIKTEADLEPVTAFLADRCDSVRVMPFLPGIPCSIHGMVFPDYVLTVRPAEMVMFQDPINRKFGYAGPAGNWEPPPADVDYMREAARSVGDHLRAHHDYRGVFTIDGVMTRRGFLPTELNPRWGGGLRAVTKDSPVPTIYVHTALVAGVEADWRPDELEQHYRASSVGARQGRGLTVVTPRFTQTEAIRVRLSDGRWVPAGDDEADGTLTRGPAAAGGLLRIEFTPPKSGASVAPEVLSAWRLANELWDAGIGELIPAQDIRT